MNYFESPNLYNDDMRQFNFPGMGPGSFNPFPGQPGGNVGGFPGSFPAQTNVQYPIEFPEGFMPGGFPQQHSGGHFPFQPGGHSGGGPFPQPGGQQMGGGPPQSPPPAFQPEKQDFQTFAIDPGAIRGCLFRFTYIWLNRDSFWFFPTFVGRNSVAGFRWFRNRWSYFGIDLNRIESFRCF